MVSAKESKTYWVKSWNFLSYPMGFIKWWYKGFVPYLSLFIRRIVRLSWDYLSLGLVIKGFFKPWKNSNNSAAWVAGLLMKSLYLIFILPLWVLEVILLYIVLLFFIALWLIPFLILWQILSGTIVKS